MANRSEALFIKDSDGMETNIAAVNRVVAEVADATGFFLKNTTELDSLGKNLTEVLGKIADMSKLLTETADLTVQAQNQLVQFKEDIELVTNTNISL